jgi:hypothetical protein
MHQLRNPTAVALATTALLLSAGGAYAYWAVNGAGTGTVTVATVKPLVIEQVDVKGLVLGRPAELSGKINNPNDFQASLLGNAISVKVTLDRGHQRCDIANFSITPPSSTAKLIEANGSVELDKGSITLLNTELDQAACQGATLTLDYLLTTQHTPPAIGGPTSGPTATQAPEPPATAEPSNPVN